MEAYGMQLENCSVLSIDKTDVNKLYKFILCQTGLKKEQ